MKKHILILAAALLLFCSYFSSCRAQQIDDLFWQRVNPQSTTPSARTHSNDAAWIYGSGGFVFGGEADKTILDDFYYLYNREAPDVWINIPKKQGSPWPEAVRDAMTIAYNSSFVIAGGAKQDGSVSCDIWVYFANNLMLPTNGYWKTVDPVYLQDGPCRYGTAISKSQGWFVFFGGVTKDHQVTNDLLYTYDGREWRDYTKPAAAVQGQQVKPPARAFASLAFDPAGNKMYLFGGTADGEEVKSRGKQEKGEQQMMMTVQRASSQAHLAFNDLWVFDISTKTWKQVSANRNDDTVPSARTQHHSFIANGAMYVVAGKDAATGEPLNDIWKLDLATLTWTKLKDAPFSPRYGQGFFFGSFNFSSKQASFYFVGGADKDQLFDEAWKAVITLK